MLKRLFIASLILLIPALLFISVWQSYRYDMLSREVAELEQQQKDLFEQNKKIVMGIEFLKSPFRINKIADEDLELKKIEPDKILRIDLGRDERQDG
ncbi:MAG: cell division protein FtsL [Spirochaetales bacterium]|uniref:Cell division protein FtsL n=1 Tax=Candidatus Thalassospirochaeta sargassi TaxID=3119039 RepID=A0AAJ1IFU7_9SPIO|nr:cell division protein FtsL [Spirochaetales bacterium]